MISFSAEGVANTGREEAVFPSRIICAKNVEKDFKFEAQKPCLPAGRRNSKPNDQSTKIKEKRKLFRTFGHLNFRFVSYFDIRVSDFLDCVRVRSMLT